MAIFILETYLLWRNLILGCDIANHKTALFPGQEKIFMFAGNYCRYAPFHYNHLCYHINIK